MSLRRLLAIHQTPKIRDVIRRFLASEMSDIEVEEAGSAAEAIQRLEQERFDIVLCATTIDGMDGRAISAKMRSIPLNQEAHFILLISSGKEGPLTESLRRGFENYMHIPFTAKELARKVNEKVDPRTWRRHERLHIPDTTAILHLASGDVEATVVNISASGLLCDFPAVAQWNDIWKDVRLSLQFPPAYDNAAVRSAQCRLLRMNVLPMRDDQPVPHVRAAWTLVALPEDERTVLEGVLERASRDQSFHAPDGFAFE